MRTDVILLAALIGCAVAATRAASETADLTVRPSPPSIESNEAARRAMDLLQDRWSRISNRAIASVCSHCRDARANRPIRTPFLLGDKPAFDDDGGQEPQVIPVRKRNHVTRTFLLPGIRLT